MILAFKHKFVINLFKFLNQNVRKNIFKSQTMAKNGI
jgi:hypothetical protein